MCEYVASKQSSEWTFASEELLDKMRRYTRSKTLEYIANRSSSDDGDDDRIPVFCHASVDLGTVEIKEQDESNNIDEHMLSIEDEYKLLQFYSSMLSKLVGPNATLARLRRDMKVTATAGLLFRRFYLSNSILLHDPKVMLVASVFLASKVEDATVDIRHLEEVSEQLDTKVPIIDILKAELNLISGVQFDLLCFHAYKSVTAFTEDLRTFLKSVNKKKVTNLKQRYDRARKIVDDVCVSDLPLLYSPGQIGLAALILAFDDESDDKKEEEEVDLIQYIHNRFDSSYSLKERELVEQEMMSLKEKLKGLKNGSYGCGNYGIDFGQLKAIYKKLKKSRVWSDGNKDKKKSKKKKKRKAEDQDLANE